MLNIFVCVTLSRKAKLNVYETIIRPVVTYGRETWTLTQKDESQINIWERKVLRGIFGQANDRGMLRIKSNKKLADLYEEIDLVTAIKTLRLRWLRWDTSVGWKNREIPKKLYKENLGEEGREGSHVQGGLIMLKMI
jgi:hypothetical protein